MEWVVVRGGGRGGGSSVPRSAVAEFPPIIKTIQILTLRSGERSMCIFERLELPRVA